MTITNIAGYKFISLHDLNELRAKFLKVTTALNLRGTILLSEEGINFSLAAAGDAIASFKSFLKQDERFADITFRESISAAQPFKFLKVKIRKEIITMRRPEVRPDQERAPSISPQQLKQWLDEKRDVTMLDTRNDYEVRFGSFENAVHFELADFNDFPEATEKLNTTKPVVMFCTGGIRCEKAAIHLQNAGFPEVYQLDGGILNYFSEVGGEHYQGECFVFDHRVSVNAQLKESGTVQCKVCYGPVTPKEQESLEYIADVSCPSCNK